MVPTRWFGFTVEGGAHPITHSHTFEGLLLLCSAFFGSVVKWIPPPQCIVFFPGLSLHFVAQGYACFQVNNTIYPLVIRYLLRITEVGELQVDGCQPLAIIFGVSHPPWVHSWGIPICSQCGIIGRMLMMTTDCMVVRCMINDG